MNYLEKVQELKRIEEEKKARLARMKEDIEKNSKAYLSDLTFMNFEKYIKYKLPTIIEDGLGLNKEKFDNKTEMTFFINEGIYDNILSDGYSTFGIVNKEEFLAYIRNIPGHISSTLSDGRYTETFELDTLITYYYEKLQELEHFNISVKR